MEVQPAGKVEVDVCKAGRACKLFEVVKKIARDWTVRESSVRESSGRNTAPPQRIENLGFDLMSSVVTSLSHEIACESKANINTSA